MKTDLINWRIKIQNKKAVNKQAYKASFGGNTEMKKKTDLKIIKEIAKSLLSIEPVETDYSPIVIQHPFFSSGIVAIRNKESKQLEVVNILESEENWQKAKEEVAKQIESITSINQLGYLLNKPYRLHFLSLIERYINDSDLGTYINYLWTTVEVISMDDEYSKRQLLKLLQRSDKEKLMDSEERRVYNSLPDEVTIYRGVTDYNKENKRAFSFTLDKQVARYFANRFQTGGYVYECRLQKENIIAYFGNRSEQEIVVDYTKLDELKLIEIINENGEVDTDI